MRHVARGEQVARLIKRSRKISVLGDLSVGKTSLIRRFVEQRFDERYLSTMGVVVHRKVVIVEQPEPVELTMLVWDIAGSEPFSPMMQTYYRGTSGAILVCDVTRPETLASLERYADEMRGTNPGVPYVMIGNKIDLVGQREIGDDLLAAAAAQLRAPWYQSSALTGEGVDPAFQALAAMIVS